MSTCVSTVCQSMSGWVCRMNQGDLEGTVTSVGVLMPVRPKVGDKWAPASLSQAFPSILLHWAQEPKWHGAG
jgi:hypothetical protein